MIIKNIKVLFFTPYSSLFPPVTSGSHINVRDSGHVGSPTSSNLFVRFFTPFHRPLSFYEFQLWRPYSFDCKEEMFNFSPPSKSFFRQNLPGIKSWVFHHLSIYKDLICSVTGMTAADFKNFLSIY